MNKQTQSRKTRLAALAAAVLALWAAPGTFAQNGNADEATDRLTVHLTDPSRPGTVRASLVSGGITVKSYDGKDIVIEAHTRNQAPMAAWGGMHRVYGSTGLAASEENNEVIVNADSVFHSIDLVLTVPVHTSLSLRTVNNGNISVTGVDGDLDVSAINGSIALQNVSGTAVAHTLNGRLGATFARVNPAKPMAFSSLNGEIDVTFPADLKANLNLHANRGEVLSDFDVRVVQRFDQRTVEDSGEHGATYHVRVDGALHATINGGGSDIQFSSMNGNIYIRKAGSTRN
ncbi:MAG TPA: DUF4097 family beta strand repeat-containing protein [Verrucomicrobiae bacterium]|nr:DUF4097 family beta strand repeat-containing protein [Verrucomicrobiae bacterium]